MADPLLIRCPACRHVVSLPDEFLGKVVTCMQCRAAFTAPAPAGDGLTAPTLLRPGRRKVSAFLFVPMFGLLLLGAAGVLVNGYLYVALKEDPGTAKTFAGWLIRQQAKETPDDEPGPKGKDGKATSPTAEDQQRWEARRKAFEADQERRIDESAAAAAPYVGAVQGPFALVSLGVLAGGMAFAARRFYWLAFVGCFLAMVNLNHACCVPGAVVGIWGFFALISDEGRRHFDREPSSVSASGQ